jgi:hypothetical protein
MTTTAFIQTEQQTETAPAKRGRPAKYASAAERQAAYRARNTIKTVAVDGKVAPTIERLAALFDLDQTEVINHLLKFALANRDWNRAGMTGWAKKDARFTEGKRPLPMSPEQAEALALAGLWAA